MLLSLCGGWGLQSHFHVQPNHCVEVVLRCVVVGVVTKSYKLMLFWITWGRAGVCMGPKKDKIK